MADDTGFKEGILTLTKYSLVFLFILAWVLVGVSLGVKKRIEQVIDDSSADFEFTPQNVSNFNPDVLFCGPGSLSENAEASVSGVSLGSIHADLNLGAIVDTSAPPENVASVTSCPGEQVLNRCEEYTIPYLFDLIGRSEGSDDSKNDFCPGDKQYADYETWCDSTHVLTSTNDSNQRNKLIRKCCKDPPGDDSLFDITKVILYLLITTPILVVTVYKVLQQTYLKSKDVKNSAQQSRGFVYLAELVSPYSKYIYFLLILLLVIIPLGKWFMIAISCPSEDSRFDSGKCGVPCSQDSDCTTLHGNCGYCITDSQNVSTCQNPSFVDAFGSSFELAELDLGLCEADLENSKLLPGQVIHINDTANPFTVTIPPDAVTLPEDATDVTLKPEFNNFVNLQSSTVSNGRCPGNSLNIPGLRGTLSEQDLDIEDEPHNKVYINGTVEGSNSNPCSEIVIPSATRNLIEGALDALSTTEVSQLGDTAFHNSWSQEFELKRITCAEQNGRCYMKDYPCSLNDVPIPLKHLDGGLQELTIGELSQEGCKRAAYPCRPQVQDSCSEHDGIPDNCIAPCIYDNGSCVRACTTIKQLDVDGTHTQLVEGKGVCKSVKWESDNWLSDDSEDSEYRCIDPDNWNSTLNHMKEDNTPLPAATYTYSPQNGFTSQCTHTPRFPQRDDLANEPEDTYVFWETSLPYGSDYKLCTESSDNQTDWEGEGSCPDSYSILPGMSTYLDSDDTTIEQIRESCCYQQYATSDLVGEAEVITGPSAIGPSAIGPSAIGPSATGSIADGP